MTEPYTITRRFPFELGRYDTDRNDREVINLLPGLYLNIFKAEKMLQFLEKKFSQRRAWHFILAQEAKRIPGG